MNAQGCAAGQLDSDDDGVNDAADQCPNTPATETADAQGCSASQSDSDGDGVSDAEDAFPNDPEESADTDGDGVGDNADRFPTDPNESADTDNDGVGNNGDDCAATPAGQAVDMNGCSANQRDTDGDGVNDLLDAFPNDPNESADTDGDGVGDNADRFPSNPNESADADGDSVGDNADMCPNTAMGATVNAAGCAAAQLDSDGDGVSDAADQCPNTAMGATVNAAGCSSAQTDSDNDGVNDSADQCPNTPAGASVNAAGCSAAQLDADEDGVSDDADQCPATPADEIADAEGCSVNQLEGDADAGAAIWAAQCSVCHGNFVNDGLAPTMNIDPENLLETTVDNLASYIEANMPSGRAAECVGQCAADAAAFVLTLEPEPVAEPDAANGAALYVSKSCGACHGMNGEGGFAKAIAGATEADLRNAIATVDNMASFSSLTDKEIRDIGAHIESLPTAPVGNAANGQALYTSKGCAGCHGANRQGSGPFPALTAAALAPKYADAGVMTTKIKSMSSYSPTAATNDAEALDIATFLLQ